MTINGLRKVKEESGKVLSDYHLSLHRGFDKRADEVNDNKALLFDRGLTNTTLSKDINSDPGNSQ